ncbi:MAG: sigma factor-like helix-turn-helix DNA-binding protein [Pyrobaculum sp.]
MSVKLTDTERRVAELYSKGLRPREIAERLGISINTVYKALSKARKVGNIVEEKRVVKEELSNHYTFTMPLYGYVPQTQQHVEVSSKIVVVYEHDVLMKKLDEIISILNALRTEKAQRILLETPQRILPDVRKEEGARPKSVKGVETSVDGNGHLPDALKRNVWVGIIRSRST